MSEKPASVLVRDPENGNFLGHSPRECGEHRTVGTHRAWCYDCGEWCSPASPCVRCEIVGLRQPAPPCTCARVRMPAEPHEPDCAFGTWWTAQNRRYGPCDDYKPDGDGGCHNCVYSHREEPMRSYRLTEGRWVRPIWRTDNYLVVPADGPWARLYGSGCPPEG